ncbi:hypothetical protein IRM63_06130 [Leuconostoc citreum]|uniref:hypothetical protein n=1 Tax=Leuconostoc citreum TaxID=33964 RepID=UPI001888F08C|nr:hypothetical protein [Leuconostoc citreum]QOY97075.1 hypothetical protein IRM63_06130 [Leuconostoc citreum]
MTFDDVIKEIYNPLIYQWPSPSGEMVSVAKQKTTLELVETIKELKQEYAPTIEMTQRQKDLLLHYKQHSWFSLFLGKLNDPYNEIYRSLPDLSCFDNWGTAKERENEILSAWLHPETIKVIGENNDTATSSRNKD